MSNAVSTRHLSVTLGGRVQALRDVNVDVPAGKVTGVIGPSGAGKTTFIRTIVGRRLPSHGTATVLGQPAGSPKLRSRVTYMAQDLSVYTDLTVRENLAYFAAMAGQRGAAARQTVHDVLETVELTAKANALAADLSGGQKQRVSLAVALIGQPELMVLDEPTVGLDPLLRDKLWKLFDGLAAAGTTLIVSSHSMDEARRCDNLVLIREGRVLAHSSPAELLAQTGTHSVEEAFLKLVSTGGEHASAQQLKGTAQ